MFPYHEIRFNDVRSSSHHPNSPKAPTHVGYQRTPQTEQTESRREMKRSFVSVTRVRSDNKPKAGDYRTQKYTFTHLFIIVFMITQPPPTPPPTHTHPSARTDSALVTTRKPIKPKVIKSDNYKYTAMTNLVLHTKTRITRLFFGTSHCVLLLITLLLSSDLIPTFPLTVFSLYTVAAFYPHDWASTGCKSNQILYTVMLYSTFGFFQIHAT